MTWVEDSTMSEGKQCLQRDVSEAHVSRRGAGRTCLMFVVFLRRMMSTLQRSRLETNVSFKRTCCCSVSLLLWSVARKCCSSQVSFMSSTRCLQSCVTELTTEPNIAQTERALTRLVDTASLDRRLHQSSKRVSLHNIHVLSLFHPLLSLPVLHAQLFVVLWFTLHAEIEKYASKTYYFRKVIFLFFFKKNYTPLGRQSASSIRLMQRFKVGAVSGSVLPSLSTVAVRDPRGFTWKRALWLVAKNTGSTHLTFR